MFRIHSLEELQRVRELIQTFDSSMIQFPVDVYRTEERVSAFQHSSDLECYTYTANGTVYVEAEKVRQDRIASLVKDTLEYERTVNDTARPKTCHDCGAVEGAIHELGCDMERCPFCGYQLITCDCIYEHLGYEYDPSDEYGGLGKKVFNEGVSPEEGEKFLSILEAKGRIPYIIYPVMCGKCGRLWPDFFKVPKEEWTKYIEPEMRGAVICRSCYDKIKEDIDSHIAQRCVG